MPRVHARDDNSPEPPARVAEDMLDAAIGVDGGVQGLYAHIPFCAHRCHYCDFFTVAGRDDERSDFVSRLLAEADVVLKQLPAGIRTVFVGGGTPTHLPVQSLQELLLGLRQRLDAGGHQLEEWTIEANPDTVSTEVADALASAGVTRVSLGAQSFHEPALKMLERRHDPANVEQAMSRLRGVGITDLSLDLIFAVPELSDPLGVWARDLDAALSLDPKHLSCYGLTYEAGTPLRRRLDRGGSCGLPRKSRPICMSSREPAWLRPVWSSTRSATGLILGTVAFTICCTGPTAIGGRSARQPQGTSRGGDGGAGHGLGRMWLGVGSQPSTQWNTWMKTAGRGKC